MTYRSPLEELRFILDHIAPLRRLQSHPAYADFDPEGAGEILGAAARLCDRTIAPLNRAGDLTPAVLQNGRVQTPPGFAEGYRGIAEGGWIGLPAPQDYGGQGLPQLLNMAVSDMMAGACLALQLKPLLTQGHIETLVHHAPAELRKLVLPRLISGEWSGTMNLTEPQAGSDVGALACRAEPLADGRYAITGEKIFISWGDSDLTANICHLVLARLPDAPRGSRGISLFLVPKILPHADGSLGAPNAIRTLRLEHKMGLHGAPTCALAYEGATGWMIGAPNKGLAAMFTMMNAARLAVGIQGIGVGEAALQQATHYARERRQMGPIIDHPDVRRMLAEARADLFAARAIAFNCALAMDLSADPGAPGAEEQAARAGLLTPIAKAFGTDTGCRIADTGIQVHGGMGFIEETGAAQYLRDVRVTAIYEGTNGIQAIDLVGRKLADEGEAALRLIQEVQETANAARARMPDLAEPVWEAAELLCETTEALLRQDPVLRLGGATPYLQGFARVLGAHYHLVAALTETTPGPRSALARVFIRRLLPLGIAELRQATEPGADLYALSRDELAA